MFIGSGRPSHKKNAYAILEMLSVGKECFSTYFTPYGTEAAIPDWDNLYSAMERLTFSVDFLSQRLSSLEEKINGISEGIKTLSENM
jgi:hypothetical protein